MPFFDADNFVVRVEYAQFGSGNVVVGSSIVGSVSIDVLRDCEVRGVLLQYFCDALHYFTPSNGEDSQRRREMVKVRGHSVMKSNKDLDRLHSAQYVLFGSRKGSPVSVAKGTYRYPFVIPVPAHLPPTVLPEDAGHFTGCCDCCCASCQGVTLIGVRHQLKIEVIIPNSFYDNQSKWPFTVVSALRPADVNRISMPPVVQYAEPADCGSFLCESLAWSLCRRPDDAVRLTLRLPRVTIAIRQHYSLPFELTGAVQIPMHVSLVRTTHLLGEDIPRACRTSRMVVASQYVAPNPIASPTLVTQGEIPLTYPMLANTQLLPSINTQRIQVAYHVEVEPVLGGCCVAIRQRDLAKVPVLVVQDILPQALPLDAGSPPTEPFPPQGVAAGAAPSDWSIELRAPQYGGMGATASTDMALEGPHQPWPWQAAPAVEEATYAYVPPPGQQATGFNPAASVTDTLPPAVWGVPLEGQTPNSTRGLVDPYAYPGSTSQRSARAEVEGGGRKEASDTGRAG